MSLQQQLLVVVVVEAVAVELSQPPHQHPLLNAVAAVAMTALPHVAAFGTKTQKWRCTAYT